MHILQEHLIKPSNFGTPHRKNSIQSTDQFRYLLSILHGTDCTLHCDNEPLTPFFTSGMSNHVLDWWALQLQQFNVKFEHIQGKKNVVADAISRFRMFVLYHDNNNKEVQLSLEDAIENIIKISITSILYPT